MSSLAARRSARRPALYAKLEQMMLPLSPLVQFDTGRTHPAFPRSMLQFLLLTDDQLESLASFYHQRTPNVLHACYPCPVSWPRDGRLTLQDKRRKFGRFIGLRGCETPRVDGTAELSATGGAGGCPGNCQTLWDAPVDSPYFCYACAMREVQQILDGTPGGQVGATTTATAATTTTTATTATGGPYLSVRRRSRNRTNPRRLTRDDKPRRPATYALRRKQMSSNITPSPPPPETASPAWSPLTRPLTVEEILENASRARLEEDADDALLRRKVGHY